MISYIIFASFHKNEKNSHLRIKNWINITIFEEKIQKICEKYVVRLIDQLISWDLFNFEELYLHPSYYFGFIREKKSVNS